MQQMPKFDFGEPFVGLERDGVLYLWVTRKIWALANDLPVFDYEVASFECFDKDVWFGSQHTPTVYNVLSHYKKIEAAHFGHPIILSQDGKVLDGVHRICKAYLEGRKTLPAVKFEKDPEPDRKHLLS
jgi:hypothetical protein